MGTFLIHGQWKELWNCVEKKDWLLVVFVLFTIVVNGIRYIQYGDKRFIVSSMYLVFCTIVVIIFRNYLKDASFRSMIYWIFGFGIILQTVLLITGVGQYLFEHRYVGSFNDPNQLGFFLIGSMFMMSILTYLEQKRRPWNVLLYLCGIFLVVLSKSTGVTLGLICWGFGEGILALYQWGKKKQISIRKIILIGIGSLTGISILLGVGVLIIQRMQLGDEYNLFVRIGEKIGLILDGGLKNLCASRGIDRMWQYPINNLLGAGEGAYTRFQLSMLWETEIHSSFLSLLFCYGVIPFAILLVWIYKNIRKVPMKIAWIYLALLAESMVLVNYRQPLFWMLFVVGALWELKSDTGIQ